MSEVITGCPKQITGFAAHFFSVTGLAAGRRADVTDPLELIFFSRLFFKGGDNVENEIWTDMQFVHFCFWLCKSETDAVKCGTAFNRLTLSEKREIRDG